MFFRIIEKRAFACQRIAAKENVKLWTKKDQQASSYRHGIKMKKRTRTKNVSLMQWKQSYLFWIKRYYAQKWVLSISAIFYWRFYCLVKTSNDNCKNLRRPLRLFSVERALPLRTYARSKKRWFVWNIQSKQ